MADDNIHATVDHADTFVSGDVQAAMDAYTVTAAIVCFEYVDGNGERALWLGWDDESPQWLRHGMLGALHERMP